MRKKFARKEEKQIEFKLPERRFVPTWPICSGLVAGLDWNGGRFHRNTQGEGKVRVLTHELPILDLQRALDGEMSPGEG